MIPEDIKNELFNNFKKVYPISDKDVLLFLESLKKPELVFEAVDYLKSKHLSIDTSMEFRRKKAQLKKIKETEERIKNKKTCLDEEAFMVLVDFIEKHKESRKYYSYEYNNTFKHLNLNKEQFREVWCTITNLGIEQVFEEFKAKPYDPTSKVRYRISAVGVSFGERQSIISELQTGDQLRFVPEPNNSFDRHAVRIETNDGFLIGYVSKDYNTEIFNNLIEKKADYNPKVYEITGRNQQTLGVIVDLFITRLKEGTSITINAKGIKSVRKSYVPQRKHLYYYETEDEEIDREEELENHKIDKGYLDDSIFDRDESLRRAIPIDEHDEYDDNDFLDYRDNYREDESYSDDDEYLDPEYYTDYEDDEIELGEPDESGCY